MRIWLPTNPPIATDFDIIEEGNVPLLLSLPQMRNLRFTIELSPEAVYVRSPAFGNKRVLMKSSTSNHIVLDLCGIEGLPRNLSRIITNPDTNLNYPSFLSGVDDTQDSKPAHAAGADQEEKKVEPAHAEGTEHAHAAEDEEPGEEAPEAEEPAAPPAPVPVARRLRKKVRIAPDAEVPGLESNPSDAAPPPPKPSEGDATKEQGIIPPALARLHARLSKEVELYKLHVKHYRMSPTQFRKRTSQLALPDAVYEKYEKVCKGCSVCATPKQAPSRSRISGIRAVNFGDIIFVDHAELKFDKGTVVVLLILDAATHLLWAQAQTNAEEKHTLQCFREWIDQNNCIPKTVVGDMAFFTDSFKKFYTSHGIKMMPTGPRTPWPNRAETAVRLFRRQFLLMTAHINLEPSLKSVCPPTHQADSLGQE
jgi:hypothetical protein